MKHKTTLYSWRPKNVGICCKLINAPKNKFKRGEKMGLGGGGGEQRQDEKNKHTKVKTKKQNAKKRLWIVS
jgi:hypothetical protein